jgi:hypothetical protein
MLLKTFGETAFRVRSLPERMKVGISTAEQLADMRAATSNTYTPTYIFGLSAIGMRGIHCQESCEKLLLEYAL